MKLTQLFESSKKEVKQRNPVAQELRANPQFKSKTEIDKKKEVKKGYQKHKNKIDESSEYAEVKAILDKHGIKSSEEIEIGTEAYEELFGYYMDSGEMPYGVMKARTGMPDEWIANRVDDLGLSESTNVNEAVDKSALRAWYNKYKKYQGNNGDELPSGLFLGYMDSGIIIDGVEINEFANLVKHFGGDRDEAEDKVFYDEYEKFLPITTAMREEFMKIMGTDVIDEDTCRKAAKILGDAEDVNEADLNAWYAEQYAKELAEKEGKTWSRMSYGDKEDYRKIANKKYGVVKSEDVNEDLDDEARNFIDYIQNQGYKILSQGAGPRGISIEYQDREGGVHQVDFKDGKTFKEQDDVPTQKGRDAKHDVLTPRAKNKVLKQIKHDANKDRRSVSKDIERIAKLAGISTASTDESVDQEAGIGHKGINLKFKIKDLIQLSKKYKVQSIDPKQFQKQIDSRQEDQSKSSARVAQADLSYPIIVVDFGNNDLMIADGTHRAQKAIQLNQKINAIIIPIADMGQFRVDQLEATQDLTRQLNPLRGVVGTNTSAQMTAKGLDALSKGERPTPQQVKAVEPYVSSMAKAMQDPKTSAQMRNIIKKVN